MDLCIATNNAHKVGELAALFPGLRIRAPADMGMVFDYEETLDSFLGNSLGKARALYALVGTPVLADDSGLCVDALDGAPGVKSARYGSPDEGATRLSTPERNALLLAAMKGRTDRICRFVCAMSLVLSPDRFFVVQETCEGVLLEAPRGSGGFGYDPLFFLPETGLSMAELSPEQKNALSHRGRAAARIRSILESLEA
jgi:XTP/dITP diphosphohydrolase